MPQHVVRPSSPTRCRSRSGGDFHQQHYLSRMTVKAVSFRQRSVICHLKLPKFHPESSSGVDSIHGGSAGATASSIGDRVFAPVRCSLAQRDEESPSCGRLSALHRAFKSAPRSSCRSRHFEILPKAVAFCDGPRRTVRQRPSSSRVRRSSSADLNQNAALAVIANIYQVAVTVTSSRWYRSTSMTHQLSR